MRSTISVDADVQTGMYADIAELLRRLGLWFLVNVPANADLAETIALYRGGVETLRGTFLLADLALRSARHRSPHRRTAEGGRAARCGRRCGGAAADGCGAGNRAARAQSRASDIDLVAGAYFAIGATVGLDRLRGLASRIVALEHWDRLAIRRIVDDLFAGQRALTAQALERARQNRQRAKTARRRSRDWAEAHDETLARTRAFLSELERSGDLSIAKLTLANSQIHELAGL